MVAVGLRAGAGWARGLAAEACNSWGLGLREASVPELNPGFPRGWQEPSDRKEALPAVSGVCVSGKQQSWDSGPRHSDGGGQHPNQMPNCAAGRVLRNQEAPCSARRAAVKEKRTKCRRKENPHDGNIFRDAAMSVKDVLQSLVDDGMVDCERIGTSNYYWAFPSKALHARKRKVEVLESQLSEGNQKYANLQKNIEKAKIGRHETEERAMIAKELSSLREERDQLKAEVEKYKECDPQVVEEIRQANKIAKEAANRWTDNIFAIKSWAKRKFGLEENKIDKNFGIPEDFDYID